MKYNIFSSNMASLRTHFIESINPAKYPFFSMAIFLQPFVPQVNNTDDIKKLSKGTNLLDSGASTQASNTFQSIYTLKNSSFLLINRILNLNINNFSQLLDNNSNDFKDCQNFVHVLQLQQNEEDEFHLSQIDTVMSASINSCKTIQPGQGQNIHQKGGYSKRMDNRNQYEEDFSQVQDIEADS